MTRRRPSGRFASSLGGACIAIFAAAVQFAAPIGHVFWAPASEHGRVDLSPCVSTPAAEANHDRSPCVVCKTLSSHRTAALPPGSVALDIAAPVADIPFEDTAPCLHADLSGHSSRAPPALS